MIDEKKIEDAAINKCGFISSEFYSGAKWAINEFLKDLWHPASEEPKRTNQENEFVECLVRFKDDIVCLYNYDTWHHWWCSDEDNQKFLGLIDKWLYIDDLLPKEEEDGNEKE
jgi:hypothetical protein